MKKYISMILIIAVATIIVLWQNDLYQNKIALLEDEVRNISLNQKEQTDYINQLKDDKKILVSSNKKLEEELTFMKYSMLKHNLPQYWYNIWDNFYKQEGALTDEQLEEINFLLQPYFSYNNWNQVNPLSCFFTSYYKDVSNINIDNFLRYFPYGEVPEELSEYEELRQDIKWPFKMIALENIPVPIHRYKSKVVQDIFTTYSDIGLDDLNDIGFDETLYLESTDAFYNFTSDFGPGTFVCTEGIVKEGIISLYGYATGRIPTVLIIEKKDEQYYIKSFYKE